MPELRRAGVEPFVGDPDRIASLIGALEQVTVACVLLGSSTGDPELVAALHTTRLEMLMTKLVDTTARGIVYEASGTVDAELLSGGATIVRSACERSRIPHSLIEADPEHPPSWTAAAVGAVERVLE